MTGELEVLSSHPPDAEPSRAPQATRPGRLIHLPAAPWPAAFLRRRTRWHGWSRSLRAATLLVVAVLGVLVLRHAGADSEPEHTATPTPVENQTIPTVSGEPAVPTEIPAEVPATEDSTGVAPALLTAEQVAALPLAGLRDPISGAPVDPAPNAGPGGDALHPVQTTTVYSDPGGPGLVRLPVTVLGADTWVPVIDRRPGWAMVLLASAVPDDEPSPAGWVHLTATVQLRHLDQYIRIDGRSGTVSIVAALDDDNPGPADEDPGPGGRRTFMALSVAKRPTGWPAAVWWPLLVRAERLCPALSGGIVIPGLQGDSLRGRLDATGCLAVPPALRPILHDLPAGTVVLVR
ncbi:hypothetical protein [Umezawaea sp. Da 62-37]|uniref:hypothetical protein n=1 Tax=Umezawaea sp. Da 62-37 TaxID=3075927 RepID=UPI0028F70692|nr:hypothetical protein [Umezawaea sp. Da 62-37]WNV83175.1 hypothetical protein RM788_33995 [Umezawaea sp. Da 62-37]